MINCNLKILIFVSLHLSYPRNLIPRWLVHLYCSLMWFIQVGCLEQLKLDLFASMSWILYGCL